MLGIDVDTHFREIRYSGSHDQTARWARNGDVDVGVVNAEIAEAMFADGRLNRSDIRVLWETPPYPGYVWAVSAALDAESRERLLDAFLDISADDSDHVEILRRQQARGFLPASTDDYSMLRDALTLLPHSANDAKGS